MTTLKTPLAVFLALATFAAAPGNTAELEKGRCREVDWTPGDIIKLNAAQYKQSHIILPEDGLDIVMGTKELWKTDMVTGHVFLQPTSAQPEGKETTMTVVGRSGNSYEFEVTRVPQLANHCLIVKTTAAGSAGLVNRSKWKNEDAGLQAQAQVQMLQQQLVRANAERIVAGSEAQRQTAAAVKSYRTNLFSNYEWTDGSGWFAKSGIESVQDDGRFTYIRLKSDNRGIMSVKAEIDGKPEIIEKIYDAAKREYRIAGVYEKFTLRAGESELQIKRGK